MTLVTENILNAAKTGHQASVNHVVRQWYPRIYNFSYKYFSDHDLAMDTTQKTFISMYQNLKNLKENGKFTQWLYQIAFNSCKEESRKQKRRRVFPFLKITSKKDGKQLLETFTEDLPDTDFEKQELGVILHQALNKINEEQRIVVIMKEYEGFKFREIAEILQISENTVKARMYYGLNALRKILEKWNINQETVRYEL